MCLTFKMFPKSDPITGTAMRHHESHHPLGGCDGLLLPLAPPIWQPEEQTLIPTQNPLMATRLSELGPLSTVQLVRAHPELLSAGSLVPSLPWLTLLQLFFQHAVLLPQGLCTCPPSAWAAEEPRGLKHKTLTRPVAAADSRLLCDPLPLFSVSVPQSRENVDVHNSYK